MTTTQIEPTAILKIISQKFKLWLGDSLYSVVYFPEDEANIDDSIYYILVILDKDTRKLDLQFWSEYHKNVEKNWEVHWGQSLDLEKIPCLSINFRSKSSIENSELLYVGTTELIEVLYDKSNFFKDRKEYIISNEIKGKLHPEGDMIWI